MFEVYRHHDSARVGLVNGILKSAGIETFLKNWAGSNITEIPIPSIYPAVCVLHKDDILPAKNLIAEFLGGGNAGGEDWTCQSCGEKVDGYLAECWSCQKSRIQ